MAGFTFPRRRSPAQALRSKAEVQRDHRRSRYKVSSSEFARIMVQQGDECAICTVEFGCEDGVTGAVDHDHATGAVRGILCRNCNTLLGRIADDTEWLKRALAYLEKYSAHSTA